MKIEQIFTGCLAQVAYYIESNGKAVLIDSLHEVDLYIQKAKAGSSRSSTYLKCTSMVCLKRSNTFRLKAQLSQDYNN